jgi:proteasome lid subunit RPN8/RPN11
MGKGLPVAVPSRLWVEMVRHAQADAPREAVGLLGGAGMGRIQQLRPLPNVAGPLAFFADPYAQYQAEKDLAAQDIVAVGYYHSHPGGGLSLSAEDRVFAQRRDWVYIVLATGWRGEGPTRGAAYRWIDGRIGEVSLVLQETGQCLRQTGRD